MSLLGMNEGGPYKDVFSIKAVSNVHSKENKEILHKAKTINWIYISYRIFHSLDQEGSEHWSDVPHAKEYPERERDFLTLHESCHMNANIAVLHSLLQPCSCQRNALHH